MTTTHKDTIVRLTRASKAAAEALRTINELIELAEEQGDRLAAFRESSAARNIAQILLDCPGEWVSKAALAEVAQVSPTTVPRVVKSLTDAGHRIERDTRDGCAWYRVAA